MNHRLILTEGQSEFLRTLPGRHFVVVTPASYPDVTGRFALHIVECDEATADAACKVAQGTHKAVKKGVARD